MKLKTLYRVINDATGDSFTLFAKDKKDALKYGAFPSTPEVSVTVEQVLATEVHTGLQYPIYRLKDLPKDTYFKTVNIFGYKVGKTVLVKHKDSYNRSTKKYDCTYFSDISLSRSLRGSHYVITDFTF